MHVAKKSEQVVLLSVDSSSLFETKYFQRSLLLCLLLLLPSFAISTALSRGIRLELTHADARGDFTGVERIRRAADRSHRRVNGLLGTVTSSFPATLRSDSAATAAVHASTATYLVDLGIGMPQLPLTAVLDTGSDLIWTQCDAPCRRCFPQPAPLYAPARSQTYANVSCRSHVEAKHCN